MYKIENLLIYCSSLIKHPINKILNKKLIVLNNKFKELQIEPYFGGHFILYKYKRQVYGISLNWKILNIDKYRETGIQIKTDQGIHYIMENDFKYFDLDVSRLV